MSPSPPFENSSQFPMTRPRDAQRSIPTGSWIEVSDPAAGSFLKPPGISVPFNTNAEDIIRILEKERLAHQIIHIIRLKLDKPHILNQLVPLMGGFIQADRCAFWEYDNITNQFQPLQYEFRVQPDIPSLVKTSRSYLPTRIDCFNRNVIVAPKILSDYETSRSDRELAKLRQIETLIQYQVCQEDLFFGVLELHWLKKQHAGPEDSLIELGQSIVAETAIALHQTRQLEMLQKLNEEAQQANLRKNQFLANMSHELRTPLHTIISGCSMALEGLLGPLDPKQLEYVTLFYQSGEHLLAIINDLLDIAKIEAGKFLLSHREIPLRDWLEQCISLIDPLMQVKRQTFTCQLHEPLPEKIVGDPIRLKQALCNILSNAHKFTPEEKRIHLRVYVDSQNHLVFAIRDEGPGIHHTDLERILLPFEQGDLTPAPHAQGTGLGLPLAKKIIELHGGFLEIRSEPNIGSEFRMCLPLRDLTHP